MPTLNDFIEQRHRDLDLSMVGAYELFTSKKQYTRQINNPQMLTLAKILRLAYRIAVHPLELHRRFGAGKLMLTKDDIAQLRQHYRIEPTQTTLRDANHNHIQSPAPAYEDAGASKEPLCLP